MKENVAFLQLGDFDGSKSLSTCVVAVKECYSEYVYKPSLNKVALLYTRYYLVFCDFWGAGGTWAKMYMTISQLLSGTSV